MSIPNFNNKYACIVDRKLPELAAIISSYLNEVDTFLSVFEFSSSTIEKPPHFVEVLDEHSITRTRSAELNARISNALDKVGEIDYLILAGLDKNQKSYLNFLDRYNIIEIDSIDDIEAAIGGVAYNKESYLLVRPREILQGLYLAGKSGLKLKLDILAGALNQYDDQGCGLVVVEDNGRASAVAAVNYAISIDSAFKAINQIPDNEIENIETLIEQWQDGDGSKYDELITYLYRQLDGIDFLKYKFVTFFTEGAPYSLVISNQIPVTYVNLDFYPTIFIINNIYYEMNSSIGSSIVFSPLEFGIDEETSFVINLFKDKNYWVRELIGKEASAYNIDMHVKEYPYDILHICSHGGEVKGYSNATTFIDRDGNEHTIEYDDVISYYPNPNRDEDLIKVEYKHFWRKFDGLVWRSEELKKLNHPQYVFADMLKAIMGQDVPKGRHSGVPKVIVPDSCAIKCNVFAYQAIFNTIAGYHASPFIFNNTCWSWAGISDSFLNAGARGYIGTLWEIDNDIAKLSAEAFYRNLFENTISDSLHKAISHTKSTSSENIYIFWGLHFSTLKKADSVQTSRFNIADHLMQGFYSWRRYALGVHDATLKKNAIELSKWNSNELREYFIKELIAILEMRKKYNG